MKLRIVMIAVAVFVAAGLYFHFRQSPVEKIVYKALEDNSPSVAKTNLTPELTEFINWYGPMVVDAPEEVLKIMRRFDPKYRAEGHRDRDLEEVVPTDEWIKRLLDLGVKIENYDDYSDYLADRYYAYHAATDPESLQEMKERHVLDASASFDEVIEADIRENVLFKQLLDQAMANDPKVYGGEFGAGGGFIPYREKTVYVQPGTITSGTGVPKWVVYELRDRDIGLPPSREIPNDIDVIYLDETGQPIKNSSPPSGDGGDIEGFSSGETDTVGDSTSEQATFADNFDNLFPDDLPPSDTASGDSTYEFEKPNLPQSMADLEKQFSSEGIQAELTEGLSSDRFNKAQQLIDEYGTEEGLRRLREMDPEAAHRFESDKSRPGRERRNPSTRDTSDDAASTQ